MSPGRGSGWRRNKHLMNDDTTITSRTAIRMAARFITANLLIGDARIGIGEFGFA